MRIGLSREIKDGERRVALTPTEVRALAAAGHEPIVEPGAGLGAGHGDSDWSCTVGDPWQAELVVKVKELQSSEYGRPRPGQIVFCFQHLDSDPELLAAALASGATFLAFETVGEDDGSLPLLAPMSALAGRLAVQVGAWLLQAPNGGAGVLLCAPEGAPRARVLIVGAGNAGASALAVADALGADTVVHARSARRFAALALRHPRTRFCAETDKLEADAIAADLVIGAVRGHERGAGPLLRRAALRAMRAGSVLVDVGIDQGGIAETSRPTSHSAPTYVEEGVVHYCVPNMPAACPRTASALLGRALLPFVRALAEGGLAAALAALPALRSAVLVHRGAIVHPRLARQAGRTPAPLFA